MNKLLSSIIGATLLAAPFSIQASEVNLDDVYLDESRGAYEFTLSKSPAKHIDVASSDMYIDEATGAYDHDSQRLSSDEVTELAVFSSTTRKSGPSIPGYIGNY
jgi:hypothetical protein